MISGVILEGSCQAEFIPGEGTGGKTVQQHQRAVFRRWLAQADGFVVHLQTIDLDEAVVDLCTILRPTLTLIDASRVLTTGGPGGPGKVLPMNKVVASTDMVAADALAVELGTWYGRKFKARQVRHVNLAHKRGLGNMNTAQLSVKEVNA